MIADQVLRPEGESRTNHAFGFSEETRRANRSDFERLDVSW